MVYIEIRENVRLGVRLVTKSFGKRLLKKKQKPIQFAKQTSYSPITEATSVQIQISLRSQKESMQLPLVCLAMCNCDRVSIGYRNIYLREALNHFNYTLVHRYLQTLLKHK